MITIVIREFGLEIKLDGEVVEWVAFSEAENPVYELAPTGGADGDEMSAV